MQAATLQILLQKQQGHLYRLSIFELHAPLNSGTFSGVTDLHSLGASNTPPLAVTKQLSWQNQGSSLVASSLLTALSRIHTPLDDNDLEGLRALQHQEAPPEIPLRQQLFQRSLAGDPCGRLHKNHRRHAGGIFRPS